jgi:acetoin utilization deacetylase AcuC-like enzyme
VSRFRLKVFYAPEMVAAANSFSPSAEKPREAVAEWLKPGHAVELMPVVPVTREELALAHDPAYVRDVLELRMANGFGNYSWAVAQSLPWTCGAMLSAARWVVDHGSVACAPVSGFHHAGYASGGGYCTFNGLMVAARALLREGKIRKVAILDCDQHYGNGTDGIIRALGMKEEVFHWSAGRTFGRRDQVALFFLMLDKILEAMAGYDLLLYQAGADSHVDDPLGGWMTAAEMKERDRRVFHAAKRSSIPLVWNLAGGYQRDKQQTIRPVLEIHTQTLRMCVEIYGAAP